MDEIPTQPVAEPAPLSWPVADSGAKRLRKIPRRTLTVSIATAALVVVGGAVVAGAVAAAPDGNGTPTPAAPGQVTPGQPGGGPMMQNGNGPRMAGPGRAVHGEYTVPNGNGGYATEEMQRGSITAVNGATFTVKSEDGYTHDWVTDANTKYGMRQGGTNGALTTGQNVMVMGTKDGDTFHAVRVMTTRQDMGRGQMPQMQNGQQSNGQTQNGQPQNGQRFGGRGGQFGHRFGGGMPNGPMQNGPMQSAPAPGQMPTAPESSPTPTQAS